MYRRNYTLYCVIVMHFICMLRADWLLMLDQ